MRLNLLSVLLPFSLFCQTKKESIKKEVQTDLDHIKIGSQIWMTKNLDVICFRNGDSIKQAKTDAEWIECAKKQMPAWCYFTNNKEIGKKYGVLYNWYAVNDSRGLAPTGYKIPSDTEWKKLVSELGGESIAAPKMRYGKIWGDSILVTSPKGNFGSLPTGWRKFSNDKTEFLNNGAYWWTSTSQNANISWSRYITIKAPEVKSYCYDKGSGMSIRCLKVVR